MDGDFLSKSQASYQSAIERCDTVGISGWCIRIDVPHEPLALELSCNGIVLAQFTCDRLRRDLRHPLLSAANDGLVAGFSFNWSKLNEAERSHLLAYLDAHPDLDTCDCLNIKTADGYLLDAAWARRQNQIIPASDLLGELKLPLLNPSNLEADIRAGEHEKWQKAPVYSDHLEFLRCAAAGTPLEQGLKLRLGSRTHSTWVGCELLRLSGLRVRRLEELKPAELQELEELGVIFDRLQDLRTYLVPPVVDDLLETLPAGLESEMRRRRVAQDDRYVHFQDQIVSSRSFKFLSPITGETARLIDSVKIFDRQVFTFSGGDLMQIMTGGNMNSVIGLYFLRTNIFVLVDSKETPNSQNYYTLQGHMLDLMVVYHMRLFKNYDIYIEALNSIDRDLPGTVVAVHGRAENPAHHSWNYLSAFQRLSEAGLMGNVDIVVRPPTEYYGPVENMYPGLAHAQVISFPEKPAIDPFPFSPEHVVLQLGGNFITRELKQRIHAWAMREVSEDFVHKVRKIATEHSPLVWIGLRVGDKSWIEQVEGVAQLAETIIRQYPHAKFLLDGFSRIGPNAEIPAKWAAAFIALNDVAADIERKCKIPGAIYSLVGNTLAESIIWAEVVDAYVSPLGSSQHKVGWHSECPGIVFTSAKVMERPAALRPGGWESQDSKVPIYMAGTAADPGQKRSARDYRSNLDNISISAEVLGRELLMLLYETLPRPG